MYNNIIKNSLKTAASRFSLTEQAVGACLENVFQVGTLSPWYRLSANHLPDKLHYLELVYLHARAIYGLKRKRRVREEGALPSKKIKDDEMVSDKNKRIHEWKIHSLGPKMKQIIPLSPSVDQPPTRPTAIPSFHPDIFPFHREYQSSSMPPSMSSVKYILATKSSFLSSSWTSSGGLLAIRFVRMADGVVAEGSIISRVSCLGLPSSSDGSSVFLLRCGSLRE